MHSLIALDTQHHRLTESITWADNRASKYAELINKEHQGSDIYQRTGTPIHPMSPLSKIFWMKHEQSDIYKQTAMFADIKLTYSINYLKICHRLPMASATGMFNLENLTGIKRHLNCWVSLKHNYHNWYLRHIFLKV